MFRYLEKITHIRALYSYMKLGYSNVGFMMGVANFIMILGLKVFPDVPILEYGIWMTIIIGPSLILIGRLDLSGKGSYPKTAEQTTRNSEPARDTNFATIVLAHSLMKHGAMPKESFNEIYRRTSRWLNTNDIETLKKLMGESNERNNNDKSADTT